MAYVMVRMKVLCHKIFTIHLIDNTQIHGKESALKEKIISMQHPCAPLWRDRGTCRVLGQGKWVRVMTYIWI